MAFQVHQPDSIRFYSSSIFPDGLVTQAFFTRLGGVSSGSLASLNMGLTVGDEPDNVYRNRELAFNLVGRSHGTLSDSWLVHGTEAVVYRSPRPAAQQLPPKADIILTDNPEVTLFMRYADCVPIALVDPIKNAIALAHAGWQGSIKGVAQHAVANMVEVYGSDPADILAAIGPSIGPQRYEVGPEVVEQVRSSFGSSAGTLLPKFGESTHFDLWGANRLALERAGVKNIDLAEICSFDHADEWFSHRASGGQTGRFGVLLALKD
jgi:YfiH family protein